MDERSDRTTVLYVGIPSLVMLLVSAMFLVASPELIERFGKEDGVFETAGAVFFLLASLCFLRLFFVDLRGNDFGNLKTRRNVFYLLLGLLLFFGFGEEISWGQRVLGIETPQLLQESNAQREITVHNLWIFQSRNMEGDEKVGLARMLTGARLFSVFWFVYCVMIPVLSHSNAGLSRLIGRVNLPIVPLVIGLLFVANYLLAKGLAVIIPTTMGGELTEAKEAGFAMLFLAIGTRFLADHRLREDTIQVPGRSG